MGAPRDLETYSACGSMLPRSEASRYVLPQRYELGVLCLYVAASVPCEVKCHALSFNLDLPLHRTQILPSAP